MSLEQPSLLLSVWKRKDTGGRRKRREKGREGEEMKELAEERGAGWPLAEVPLMKLAKKALQQAAHGRCALLAFSQLLSLFRTPGVTPHNWQTCLL